MKGRAIRYSADELAWLEANCTMVIGDYHQAFVSRFGRGDVTASNLNSLRKRKGWRTGRTGRFQKGQVSHNKGKKGVRYPGSEKGWFGKGHKPANRVPMWTERTDDDGYIWMKVPVENPYTGHKSRFMLKHRYLWEQAKGPLPEGYALKCLDGDKTNCDPSNWEAVPRALLPRLNGRFGRDYDTAPAELKPTILATAKLEHAVRTAKKDAKP